MAGEIAALLELVLPTSCGGCGAERTRWCARCRTALGPARQVWVPALVGGPPAFALAGYAGPVRSGLLAFKERGRADLATEFGEVVAATLAAAPAHGPGLASQTAGGLASCYLVPVPSRPVAARRRGGQHVQALATSVAAGLAARGHSAAVAPALRMTIGARDSVGMSRAGRRANLAGRIRLRPAGAPPAGGRVVLVDDLITTGTTAAACARVLARSGVPVAAVMTIAVAGSEQWWTDGMTATPAGG